MVLISDHAANACLYTSYAVCLILGLVAAYYSRNKGQFLSGNGTRSALPLTFNFIASGLGAGIFVTYPQIAAYGGLHGLLVYSVSGAIPFILFGALGPIIRRRCPEGFVLTEWIRMRYGPIASMVVSACSILTIFLFMVGELSSIKSAVESMTTVPGLPVMIVECVIVSIYTSLGGFYTAFLTDNIQVITFLVLLIVCTITVGVTAKIDPTTVGPSRLLDANLLGWKLMYILPVAIVTNDCFMAGFWLRTFASKTDRDLYISCALTSVLLFAICALVGVPGLLAVWDHLLDPSSPTFGDDSNNAFYYLIASLPRWLSGFLLVLLAMLSSCTFDSLQSAMTSSISNDFLRNRVRSCWVRVFVLMTMVPCIVVALRALNVLNIYLIVDVLSACVVPVMFLGLSRHFFFLTGLEIVLSIVGGIITIFVYGTIYYHSASQGGALLLMESGLYNDDWGAFGAFVAAPVGSFIGAFVALAIRFVWLGITRRKFFAVFQRPADGAAYEEPVDLKWFQFYHRWYESPFMQRWGLVDKGRLLDFWIFEQPEHRVQEMGPFSQKFHHFTKNTEFIHGPDIPTPEGTSSASLKSEDVSISQGRDFK